MSIACDIIIRRVLVQVQLLFSCFLQLFWGKTMSKRNKAVWAILQHSAMGGGAAALPTPGLETHKHIALSANEIAMCVRIGSIYSESTLSKDKVKELLIDSGIAVSAGGGLAFVASKVGHGAVNEMLNFIPVIGWGIKGALASSLTATVGWAFTKFCSSYYGE